jgi:hypothetical protein
MCRARGDNQRFIKTACDAIPVQEVPRGDEVPCGDTSEERLAALSVLSFPPLASLRETVIDRGP